MAQQLKTHLLAETWQRNKSVLPSNCSLPYHVYNIKAIKISGQSHFSSSKDHAKWCISKKGARNRWTCIGDLNRSPHQAFRSGGFICTQNQHIYQAFQGLVLYYENCNQTWWRGICTIVLNTDRRSSSISSILYTLKPVNVLIVHISSSKTPFSNVYHLIF